MRSIAVLILDALRYDHLGCYGYERNVSPNIDKLADKSVVYTNAYTLGSATPTSIPKMLSGNPHAKRVGMVGPWATKVQPYIHPFIRKYLTKLFANYKVIMFSERSLISEFGKKILTCCITSNPFYRFGLHKDFDKFYFIDDLSPEHITEKALEVLERFENLFLLCHYMQPHYPYTAPFSKYKFTVEEVQEIVWKLKFGLINKNRINEIISAYDDNIRWVDSELKYVIDKCLEKDFVIVVTSDHGECLGEYRMIGHPYTMFCEELNHIPLIIYDGENKGIYDEKFWLHDLLPYLLKKVMV